MTKKELFFPIFLVLLSVAFVSVSLAVILTKGKSGKWINRKMKIGALMLSLTLPTLSQGQDIDTIPEVTCYVEVIGARIELYKNSNGNVSVPENTKTILKGKISDGIGNCFSFAITDTIGKVIRKENISAIDGEFNDIDEEFEIKISKNLNEGVYFLNLYSVKKSEQNPENYISRYKLHVRPKHVQMTCYKM